MIQHEQDKSELQSLFSMWLYPRITKAPEPSPSSLNHPATTLPETLPLTSAQAATSAPTVKTSSGTYTTTLANYNHSRSRIHNYS